MNRITRSLNNKGKSKSMTVPKTWWELNDLNDAVVCSLSKKAPGILVLSNHLTVKELRDQIRLFLTDKDFLDLEAKAIPTLR